MATYRVMLKNGDDFLLAADVTRAEAPLSANWHEGEEDYAEDVWQATPYQTADARHDVFRAAELVAEYFSDGPDDSAVARVDHIGD